MLAPTMYPLTSKLILMNFPYKRKQIILIGKHKTCVFKGEYILKKSSV